MEGDLFRFGWTPNCTTFGELDDDRPTLSQWRTQTHRRKSNVYSQHIKVKVTFKFRCAGLPAERGSCTITIQNEQLLKHWYTTITDSTTDKLDNESFYCSVVPSIKNILSQDKNKHPDLLPCWRQRPGPCYRSLRTPRFPSLRCKTQTDLVLPVEVQYNRSVQWGTACASWQETWPPPGDLAVNITVVIVVEVDDPLCGKECTEMCVCGQDHQRLQR